MKEARRAVVCFRMGRVLQDYWADPFDAPSEPFAPSFVLLCSTFRCVHEGENICEVGIFVFFFKRTKGLGGRYTALPPNLLPASRRIPAARHAPVNMVLVFAILKVTTYPIISNLRAGLPR